MRKHQTIALAAISTLAVSAGRFVLGGGWLAEKPDTVTGRWYSAAMVADGSHLFAENCAVCHGASGEGAANWQQRGADGFFPPPPLNGSGHAWHHPLRVLRTFIERGGTASGGAMPAFANQLNSRQHDAVIAYMQSRWPDEIYRIWAQKVERINTD
ncbi:MAG: cytochrome c [Gammaproteobacteria bacterium]|nr:cytochrome c [Gammaproteobacteria bacterium]